MNRKIEQIIPAKETPLVGNFTVRRALPRAKLRRIGGFVFFDHFGRATVTPQELDVPPHPHVGLQTVTYLFEGEILHTDSLGNKQIIRAGDVNWMTAGRAITHAEQAMRETMMHGIQSWVGLPHEFRQTAPDFAHFAKEDLPLVEFEGAKVRVLAGKLNEFVSPIPTFQELTYLDIEAESGAEISLTVDSSHELGVYVAEGKISVGETELSAGVLAKLSDGESELAFQTIENARFLVFGGEPLPEPTVIYWNFITDSIEEAKARYEDWENKLFPEVKNYVKF